MGRFTSSLGRVYLFSYKLPKYKLVMEEILRICLLIFGLERKVEEQVAIDFLVFTVR